MFRHYLGSVSFLTALLAASAAADTCSTVRSTTSIAIEYPLIADYEYDQTQYWSTACGALRPSCILAPSSAQEVSAIISVLNSNSETFAVKSGGHNPNNYFASVSGGPLISTKNLNQVTLNATTGQVRIGPGNRWDEVAAALDGTGYTAVGGRIGNVGVGGYMLGAGLSFMSAEYGWAANSVIEFEVVLANGTIVTASNSSNPDLFAVLKGGGNAYGIVTSYLVQGYQQGSVWGGNYIFSNVSAATTSAILKAVRDFTEYYPDEKAGIIATAESTLAGVVDLWILFLYYNGPTPPAGVFDNFTAIGPTINTAKTQSMSDLVSGNNWAVVKGSVYTIATETSPLPSAEVGVEVMQSYYDHWVETSDSIRLVPGLISSVAFQPIPKRLTRVAKEKGGDLLDLDDSVDRIIMEFDYSFLFNTDFDTVDKAMQTLYGGMKERVTGFINNGTLPNAYLPLFMNDAYFREDYFGRLKPENAALAKSVRATLDPNGLFFNRTGGFKP